MSEETGIVSRETSNQAPATVNPNLGRGHEQAATQEDLEIPRAKIVQFTSEEAKGADVKDRIPAGTFINSVSKVEISSEFIPIFRYKTYTQWNPMKKDDINYDPAFEPGDMVFTTNDRHDPRVMEGINFGPNGEAPKVTQTINFLSYFPGQKLPLVLSFSKTSFKGGKKLNTLLEEAGGDMFTNKFKLSFKLEAKAGQEYYTIDVRGNGKANPEEFATCEAIFNRFRGQNIESMAHKEDKAQFTE